MKGEIVATSSLFMNRGIAGIYHVATKQEYRYKGIGRQITLAPLKVAREMGFETAILHASQLGQVVYEKLGFRE